MIISTGMSTPEEIDRTVQVVRAEGTPFALMHCTSTYPTPYEHVQLGCITWLQDLYGVPVGFSDHTLGSFMAFAAAANGANIFEKHFTTSRALPGPDQQGSMEPRELAELVRAIPGKNLKLLGGKPLITYTIDAAHQSGAFDRTIVSTDDAAIADAARALGCELPFVRPAALARDETPHLAVMQHAVGALRDQGYDA